METIFTQHNLLFARDPAGGVEDIDKMKAAGFGIYACNVQKEIPPSRWDLVRVRAAQHGMIVVPWCYIWNLEDLDRLCSIADQWGTQPLVNIEKQIDQGVFTSQQVANKLIGRAAAISMECWLFDNVDWSPLIHLPMMLQIFPLEVPISGQYEACKAHAHTKGFSCVMYTFGTYDVNGVQPQPSDYPLKTPYQLYTVDDLTYIYPNYGAWGPTGVWEPCVLPIKPPLSVEQFPFTGPYYPDGSKFKPNRGMTVKALKIALDRMGFGPFNNPTTYFGKTLAKKLVEWKISVDLDPNPNYGKLTWNTMRAAVALDGDYAFNDKALALVRFDALSQKISKESR